MQRVVIGAGDRSLMSSLVAIEGLALSTTTAGVRQLAEKAGPVQVGLSFYLCFKTLEYTF